MVGNTLVHISEKSPQKSGSNYFSRVQFYAIVNMTKEE